MNNFDDATAAAESLFSNQSAELAQAGNDGGEATDTSDIPPEVQAQQLPPDAAAQQQGQPAEQQFGQAQPVPAVNNPSLEQQLAQMSQDMQAMTEQNTQLQSMVRELSAKNQEHIIKDAVEMPSLDIGGLAFASEDELRQAQTSYANQMREYVMAGIKDDPGIKSLIDEAERGRREREKQQMIEGFRGVPELKGFEDNLRRIDQFVEKNNDIFRDDTPMDVKYIIAKAVIDGVDAAGKADSKPSVDELMNIYNSNPEFRNAVEQQRLAAIKGSQQVPLMSASSGAANVALNLPEKPKSFDDADTMTRKLLGRG
ncbi:MAG: hypothetical protein ACI4EA_09415 [Candidatus Ornithomonoglobus sp.]